MTCPAVWLCHASHARAPREVFVHAGPVQPEGEAEQQLLERDAVMLAEQRDHLIRGFLPKRFREAGLIARTDDRGDAVMQIAPPLIADAALLDEIVDRLGDVLTDAGKQIGVARPSLVS